MVVSYDLLCEVDRNMIKIGEDWEMKKENVQPAFDKEIRR